MSNCSYCGKECKSNKGYTFSYGMPNIIRIYGCHRVLCKLLRKPKQLRNKFLYKAISYIKEWLYKHPTP